MANFQKGYHYDQALEQAVVGALINEPECIPRIHGLVEPEHLYGQETRTALEVIMSMWADGMKIDLLSVNHEVHSRKLADKFTGNRPDYILTAMTNVVASTANIEQHALFIRQMAARRKRIEIQAMADANVDDDVDKLEEIRDQLNAILTINATDDWHDMSQVMLSVHQHMEEVKGKDMLGIPTGFRELDRWTFGFQPGQLIVVAARPSVGKSAFVSGMAITAAQAGNTVGIINLEMPEEQIGARLASFYGDVEFWRIYTSRFENGQQEANLAAKMADLAGLSIHISDKTNVSAADIAAKAMKLKKRSGLNMLIIDYLQLIESDSNKRDTREREVAKISRGLKLLAKTLEIPVVILCQLNRESEKAPDKKPRMSNIRESGAIEQDADVVMLLHRDFKSGIDFHADGTSTEREGTIIVAKNRNGKIGDLAVGYDPETMKWYDPQPEFGGQAPAGFRPVDLRDYTEPSGSEEAPF